MVGDGCCNGALVVVDGCSNGGLVAVDRCGGWLGIGVVMVDLGLVWQ